MSSTAPAADAPHLDTAPDALTNFQTNPQRYRHWQLGVEGDIANVDTRMLCTAVIAGALTGHVDPPVNIVIATTEQLVYDIQDGFDLLRKKYEGTIPSMINLATGPSRTADIEKTLVLGAHGPREVFVFLLDQTS